MTSTKFKGYFNIYGVLGGGSNYKSSKSEIKDAYIKRYKTLWEKIKKVSDPKEEDRISQQIDLLNSCYKLLRDDLKREKYNQWLFEANKKEKTVFLSNVNIEELYKYFIHIYNQINLLSKRADHNKNSTKAELTFLIDKIDNDLNIVKKEIIAILSKNNINKISPRKGSDFSDEFYEQNNLVDFNNGNKIKNSKFIDLDNKSRVVYNNLENGFIFFNTVMKKSLVDASIINGPVVDEGISARSLKEFIDTKNDDTNLVIPGIELTQQINSFGMDDEILSDSKNDEQISELKNIIGDEKEKPITKKPKPIIEEVKKEKPKPIIEEVKKEKPKPIIKKTGEDEEMNFDSLLKKYDEVKGRGAFFDDDVIIEDDSEDVSSFFEDEDEDFEDVKSFFDDSEDDESSLDFMRKPHEESIIIEEEEEEEEEEFYSLLEDDDDDDLIDDNSNHDDLSFDLYADDDDDDPKEKPVKSKKEKPNSKRKKVDSKEEERLKKLMA